jgi:type I restriction enzyme S subunit
MINDNQQTRIKPLIRFSGFTDAWEQRKFSDIASTRRGLTYKPTDVSDSGIRVLRSSNIDEDFAVQNDDVFVNSHAVTIPLCKPGNILITAANGSDKLVGKHAIIGSLSGNAVPGGFMLLASTKYPYFLNASMSSHWYHTFINVYVSGGNGAIGNLNKKDLDNQSIFIPCVEEIGKIGAFFRLLDSSIVLHQRE